ncbi:probable palmitoyltransferase ZDHHC24 [Apostichopus japonicus]|uniref:probable palmitoyltransferase ZDHHC24 n=1 Tax=Stichopus japonicus TaxID=307972 RepID=UPI003AB7D781
MMVLKALVKYVCQSIKHILPSQYNCMCIANISGTVYLWFMTILLALVLFFVIIPGFQSDAFMMHFTLGLMCYIILEMFSNYFLCLYNNSYFESEKSFSSQSKLLPPTNGSKHWEYCVPCQHYYPPRAHHCPVCKRCILKRHAHCFVVGVCLGHRNLRFFLVFTFYCSVGLFCIALFTWMYLSESHGAVLSHEGLSYLYPVTIFQWITGGLKSSVFGLVTLLYVDMMLCLGSASQFAYHFIHILKGQTSHEADSDVITYDQGVFRNLSEVFGRFWILPFFLPLPLQLPSDGIHWKKPTKGY